MKKLITILMIFFLAGFIQPVSASSPTVGTITTYDTEGGAITSKTISYTVATGNNTMLVVGAFNLSTSDITGATWNGAAMTALTDYRQGGAFNYTDGRWFYILNPDTGTHDMVLSFGSTGLIKIGMFQLTNAKQGAPNLDTSASDTSGTTHTHSYTTTVANTLVIQMCEHNDVFVSYGAGQTQLWSLTRRVLASYKEQTASGSGSMSETLSGDSYWDSALLAVQYEAPPAASAPSQESDLIIFE